MTEPVSTFDTSQFRIDKARATATLTLSDGRLVHGCFFLAGSSATHAGPERVKDVLNAERGFFPFETSDEKRVFTTLYNRDHVVLVTLAGANDEAQSEPGYDVATKRSVSMLLSSGARVSGSVRIHRPQGRDRLSDYTRVPEIFRYVETAEAAVIVNVQHVVELREAEAP